MDYYLSAFPKCSTDEGCLNLGQERGELELEGVWLRSPVVGEVREQDREAEVEAVKALCLSNWLSWKMEAVAVLVPVDEEEVLALVAEKEGAEVGNRKSCWW